MSNSQFDTRSGDSAGVPAPRSLVCTSYFYCPATRLNKLLKKVDEFSPQAIVIDLEDAVHPNEKENARAAVETFDFATLREREVPVGLRVNPVRHGHGLLDLLMLERLANRKATFDFVLLPKVRSATEVEIYRAHLDRLPNPVRAFSFIETVDAVAEVDAIASVSDALCFGDADLCAELYAPNPYFLNDAQARLTAAAAKHRIPAIDTTSLEIDDMDLVEAQSQTSREVGFTGKAAIHPSQVPIINRVFAVSGKTLSDHQATISEYDTLGYGFRIFGDRVVAPPFVAKAKLMLELHETTPDPLLPHMRRSGPRT